MKRNNTNLVAQRILLAIGFAFFVMFLISFAIWFFMNYRIL
jgi:hypothetical protein